MSASAHRVAGLLRQESTNSRSEENTLTKLTRDVEAFLNHASDVPPVLLETSHDNDDDDDTKEVHLSVVAGVLEPRDVTDDVTAIDGVLLPTAVNYAVLNRQQVQEAQAMLNLLDALSADGSAAVGTSLYYRGAGSGKESSGDGDLSDESVAVFDADVLENDTSSLDDEGTTHGQPFPRILELN